MHDLHTVSNPVPGYQGVSHTTRTLVQEGGGVESGIPAVMDERGPSPPSLSVNTILCTYHCLSITDYWSPAYKSFTCRDEEIEERACQL